MKKHCFCGLPVQGRPISKRKKHWVFFKQNGCSSHETPTLKGRDLPPPLHESPPESLRAWGVPKHHPTLPVHGCGAPRRGSTCVGDYSSPRGDPATGPVHSPFISFSVRVITRVSGFTTSLIIVGPVTTLGPVPRALKMTLCHEPKSRLRKRTQP